MATQHRTTRPTSDQANLDHAEAAARLLANGEPLFGPEVVRADRDLMTWRVGPVNGRSSLVLFPPEARSDERIDARLQREYSMADQLDADWAVLPVGFKRLNGRPTLFLQDPGGLPLDRIIADRQDGVSSPEEALAISLALVGAIRKMHDRHRLHGDIKPANCFLDQGGTTVRLTGFGLASRPMIGHDSPDTPAAVTGSFAYMSPEQTGRLASPRDVRSDLYSLGVTLFELFTGTLPFEADHALEWTHRHLATRPPVPSERAALPQQVDAIILKLLEKNPDDRYQTAGSVENDLRRCVINRATTTFTPGRDDVFHGRISAPRIYGRSEARARLADAAGRVLAGGASEVVLVSGPAGIGKSSLVGDVLHDFEGRNIILASGKCDQHQWDMPYATLAQAFGQPIRQLLMKDEAELASWRTAFIAALDPHAALIADLIPELAHLIGPQPVVTPADLATAQVRFRYVFRTFLNVFASPEHPLCLFLDDLQWLDAASLDLLQSIITDPDLRYVLVICAFRDDEASRTQGVAGLLDALHKCKARLSELPLDALAMHDMEEMLADLLICDHHTVQPLAALVHEKTGGNPFFATQFVRELIADGSLSFQSRLSQWVWDIPRIREKGVTSNIAQLLVKRLKRLSTETQHALETLSLFGNHADLGTLSFVLDLSRENTLAVLHPAIHSGLVLYSNETISFVHDHIQAAAYDSIDPSERTQLHLGTGRLLLTRTNDEDIGDTVFDISAQIDKGFSHIVPSSAEAPLARLYRVAGNRAKLASAHATAQAYFSRSLLVLGDDRWRDHHDLCMELELDLAECAIVLGDLDQAGRQLEALRLRARKLGYRAQVACLAILLHFTTGRSEQAVAIGVSFLADVQAGWPEKPTFFDVEREFREMHGRLAISSVEAVAELPAMTDPSIISVMAVMTELFPAAYAVDRYLMELILLRMTNLSLEHGNCESSSVAYSALNMVLGTQFGDYATAYAFGEVARQLVDQQGGARYKARVYSLVAGFSAPWRCPLAFTGPLMEEAFRLGCATGDIAFATYNNRNRITHELVMGMALPHVQREVEKAVALAGNVQLDLTTERFFSQLGLVRKLCGFIEDTDDDEWMVPTPDVSPGLAMMITYRRVFELEAAYLTGDFAKALTAAAHVEPLRWAMRSSIEEAEYEFYAGLTCAAVAKQDEGDPSALSTHLDRLIYWERNCPTTFGCRVAILAAERARLIGNDIEAQTLYEKSIRLARAEGFLQVEGIAQELAGRYYEARGLVTAADAYMLAARESYRQWGCVVKVRFLDLHYPHLREHLSPLPAAGTIDVPVGSLDVEAVGWVSGVLSSEMNLTDLIDKLMTLAVQHSGAERGVLLLLDRDQLTIEAVADTEQDAVKVRIGRRPHSAIDLPQAILRHVLKSRVPAILQDGAPAAVELLDPYFRRHQLKSALCLPIFRAETSIGLLYMENRLTAGLFSPSRIAILDFLASQAGIWLENARLYSDLQRSDTWLREAQRLSRTGSFYWHGADDRLECSDELFRICALDPDRPMTLRDLWQRLHPLDLADFDILCEVMQRPGSEIDRQLRLLTEEGTTRHVRLVIRSATDSDGSPKCIGSLQDVTEMQRAQDALSKIHSELARISRTATLGELTASIAHEVNQPLLGIVTNATTTQLMLSRDPPDVEGARRTVERCVRDGHRVAETIRRLRGLFGNKITAIRPTDINEVIKDVVALAGNELHAQQVLVQTDFLRRLPPAAGDRAQLQQVVLTLLLNAADAMRDMAGQTKKIVLRTRIARDDTIRVDVIDNGIGFDARSAERLFESFFTTKEGGMGLGLSVSRSIVESLGGRLWAVRNDGAGATFSFTLQRHDGTETTQGVFNTGDASRNRMDNQS